MKSKLSNPLIKLRKFIAISLTVIKIFKSVRVLLAKYPVKNYSLSLTRDLVLRLQKIANLLEKSTRSWATNPPVDTEDKQSEVDNFTNTSAKVTETILLDPKLKAAPIKKTIKKPKAGLQPSEKTPSKTKKVAASKSTPNSTDLTLKN